jgi:hypothetical protein
MIDIQDLLKNDVVKNLIKKAGVSDNQVESVVKQAVSSINGKYKENPKQMSSLLSENKNTEDDDKLAAGVETDFLDGLIKRVGLSDGIANSLKGTMPQVVSQITSSLSAKGANSEEGLAGIFSTVTDFFDSNKNYNKTGNSSRNKGGLMGMLSGFFKK